MSCRRSKLEHTLVGRKRSEIPFHFVWIFNCLVDYKFFDFFERCFAVWNPKEDFYLKWKGKI